MRHAFSLLAALLLSPLASLRADSPRDLILVAGQSNAVGFDADPDQLPADPVDQGVLFWWRCGDPPSDEHDTTSGQQWTYLQPTPRGNPIPRTSIEPGEAKFKLTRQYGNYSKAKGGFGPEIGFAREWHAQKGKPLAIVKVAFSGTGMSTDWNPNDPGPEGACYRALVNETKAAIGAAKDQGIALRPRALVWVQGESDSTPQAAPNYEDALTTMLARLRLDLGAPDLAALLGVNTRFGNGKNPLVAKVIAAQKAIAENDNRSAYVDTEGAETLPPNHTHFTAAGTLEIGKRYAAALLKFDANGGNSVQPHEGEPTNAAEAAAQKAKADAEVDASYQALVAKLPPEQKAWEQVLQDQLGNFYLPIHKREKIAGQSSAWDFVLDDPRLPRALLIGDSVSRGYTLAARKALVGKANVHRAPANCGPTASGLKNIDVWLGDGRWDVIHFNFGIHDRNTNVADYAQRLEQLTERMKRTGAKLIWASTTPIPDTPDGKQTAASIVERNAVAAVLMKKHGVAIDDHFSAITPHLAEMQLPNDVHFNAKGYDFLGQQVSASIEETLK